METLSSTQAISFTFFPLPLIFTSHWWPLAFLTLSSRPQNFHVTLPTKKMSLLFFISCSRSLSPFFSLSFPGRRLLSLFLCPSLALYSKFVDNESKVNTLYNTDTETISVFRFRLYLLFSKRFPAKITASCIWVAIPVDWVVLQWYACGEDGQTVGRAYGHVITKFYRRGRLLHFLTDGAPLCPLRARELLYHLTFFLLFPFL